MAAKPVYGGSGNRWWVGLNVGSDQSTVFGTSSVLSPNGYESLPSGNAADDAQFAAAARKDAGAAKPVTISVEHVSWFNINGPYATQAAANAAIPAIQQAHPAPGEVQQLAQAAGSGSPLSGLAAIGSFFASLGQASTWERVGQVALGFILLAVGVARITHVQNFISTAVKAVPA